MKLVTKAKKMAGLQIRVVRMFIKICLQDVQRFLLVKRCGLGLLGISANAFKGILGGLGFPTMQNPPRRAAIRN